ncbi:sensor histidine kinase [Roseibium salinum]|uniref:histidine kinase n=1 Tax=Roseibium salinum TaxID=1604349 RepID=A0ABT3R436_9HYPH|nr:sensor histidine kinase [Roseibium sp. DSM 29163]MCX2723958.1 sensor histidine kinase [Roseibium sp. DSM 29163]
MSQGRQGLIWEKPGQDEERFRRYLIVALSRTGICVMLQDRRGDYLFIANLLGDWHVDAGAPPTDESLFGAELASRIAALKQRAVETGKISRMEHETESGRYFEFIVEPLKVDAAGSGDLLTMIVDESENRRHQKLLTTLLREVSHRSKNLMAIIQSLAAQTAKHSWSLPQFLEKFHGRLYSLSHSQDLITDTSWQGAYFEDLVRRQIDTYLPEEQHLVSITGENLLLTPNMSLHVGLALHELAVNAVSYGARVGTEPGITVHCGRTTLDDRDAIEISWIEELPPGRERTEIAPRFGSAVLERIVPKSVNGAADYDIGDSRISYRLVFPADSHS